MRRKFTSIDEYIASFPKNIADILQHTREAIQEAAPSSEEGISYNIPVFKQNGYLVWFAAFRDHVSLYPTMSGIRAFEKELAPYLAKKTKGTVKFPITKKIPLDLVRKIVKFRAKENMERARRKTRKSKEQRVANPK